MRFCTKCGKENYNSNNQFCVICGTKIEESTAPEEPTAEETKAAASVVLDTRFCTHCGAALHADKIFCTECGFKIDALTGANEAIVQQQSTPIIPPGRKTSAVVPRKPRKANGTRIALLCILILIVACFAGVGVYVLLNGVDSLPVIGQLLSTNGEKVDNEEAIVNPPGESDSNSEETIESTQTDPEVQTDSKIEQAEASSSVTASSELSGYPAASIVDAANDTAWASEPDANGAWGSVTIPFGTDITLYGIHLKSGYWKSQYDLIRNSRIKDLVFEFEDGSNELVHVSDSSLSDFSAMSASEGELLIFSQPHTTSTLKITVLDVYSGAESAAFITGVSVVLTPIPSKTPINGLTESTDNMQSTQINLFDVMPLHENGWTPNILDPKDAMGNIQTYRSSYLVVGDGNFAEYRTDGKYNKLTGKIIAHSRMDTNGSAKLEIYADDILVHSSPKINRVTTLSTFDVDISRSQKLRIEVVGTSNTKNRWLLILDMALVPAFTPSPAVASGSHLYDGIDLEALVLEGLGRRYTRGELNRLDAYALSILRNGMYALSGKQFSKNTDVIEFFSSCSWYQPNTNSDSTVKARFNQYQTANVTMIIEIEKENGYK